MMNSVLTNPITLPVFLVCMAAAMALGVLTALVFLHRSRHSASFALALAMLPMVVCLVIMLVNGHVGTGVAVAGAFTLVRFRSVPGTAREIAAIFTAMVIGLALGMGLVGIAAMFFLLAAGFTLALTRFNFGAASRYEKQLRITIPENFSYEGLFDDLFEKYTSATYLRKVQTTNMGTLFELTYDVRFSDIVVPKEFIDEIRARNGNLNVSIGDFSEKEML